MHTKVNQSLCPKRQLLNSSRWPIYVINLVDNTKLPSESKFWQCLFEIHSEGLVVASLATGTARPNDAKNILVPAEYILS